MPDQAFDLAIVISDLGAGGAQRVAVWLVEQALSQNIRVTVITLAKAETDHYALPKGAARIALGVQKPTGNVFSAIWGNTIRIRAIRSAIRQVQPQQVLSFVAATNILTVLATVGTGIPVIISERNDPSRQHIGQPWQWLRPIVYRFATRVCANSSAALQHLDGYIPKHKLFYVPNAVKFPGNQAEPSTRADILLNIARLHPQKAQDTLLHAFHGSAMQKAGWQLLIVGDGELRGPLEQLAVTLGIDQQVKFAGRQSDVAQYYRTARCFVLPSRFEGMPNTVLEAASHRLPIVLSDACVAAKTLLEADHACLVHRVDDVDDLREKLDVAFDDASLNQMGERAFSLVKTHHAEPQVWTHWQTVLFGGNHHG